MKGAGGGGKATICDFNESNSTGASNRRGFPDASLLT